MTLSVFFLVLLAALLHAVWNALVKQQDDRVLFMAVLVAASGFGALVTLPFLAIPAPESWPYIGLSVVLHVGYGVFLLTAYKFGDLSHVYPIARGSAVLIVAFLSVALVGEHLSYQSSLAIVVMAMGIMSLALTRKAQNFTNPRAVVFALGTGFFIAAYTITDGIGVRVAGNAHSYAGWMMALDGFPILIFLLIKRRARIFPQILEVWKPAGFMGLMSLAAYWTVIWAMSVAPIALVAAIRETSIIFALLFGVFFLKERLSLHKLTATFATMIGIVLLRMNRP